MKTLFILTIFVLTNIAFSQEIIKDTTFNSKFNYLRNTDLIFFDRYFFISGFSNNDNTGLIDFKKIDDNLNLIFETSTTFNQLTTSPRLFLTQSNNINQVSFYGNMLIYLLLQTINYKGEITYQTDSVNLKRNFLFNVGKFVKNYDFNLYHIYSMGSDSSGRLGLQLFDTVGNFVSDKKIYQMDFSIYKEIDLYSAISTKDSGLIVAGDLYNKSKKKYDVFLIRFDKNHSLVWENILECDSSRQIPGMITETSDGSIILTGFLRPFIKTINRFSQFVKKFNENGEFLWEKNYFEKIEVNDTKLFESPNGDYYMIANTFQRELDVDLLFNFCLLKTNKDGNLIWQKVWGKPDVQNRLKHIVFTGENELIISGDQGNYTYIAKLKDTTKVEVMDNRFSFNYLQLFPNPSNISNSSYINFYLQTNVNIQIELVNNLGIKVADIFTGFKEAGEHTIQFTPDANLPSGTYWLKVIINGTEQVVKPLLIVQ